jgi:predicted nucleotide-binding protein
VSESLASAPASDDQERRRTVFLVHGRDAKAAGAMREFLVSLDLRPIEWSRAVALTGRGSPYVGEILDAALAFAQAIVVLLTPDDQAQLREDLAADDDPEWEQTPMGQPRPNVLFEAGMALGRSEQRTVLVELGVVRPFSDIGGRHTIRMSDSTERRQELALRLRTAGCAVNLDGVAWHKAGLFSSEGRVSMPARSWPNRDGLTQPETNPQLENWGLVASLQPEPEKRARLLCENRGDRMLELLRISVESPDQSLVSMGGPSLPHLLRPGSAFQLQVVSVSSQAPAVSVVAVTVKDSTGTQKDLRLAVEPGSSPSDVRNTASSFRNQPADRTDRLWSQ